jgi:uncharacterized membrane protein
MPINNQYWALLTAISVVVVFVVIVVVVVVVVFAQHDTHDGNNETLDTTINDRYQQQWNGRWILH